MPDMFVLLPLVALILSVVAIAFHSGSVMLSGVIAFVLTGYISVQSGNTLLTGIYILSAFFMVMASGVFLTRTVMGDTA